MRVDSGWKYILTVLGFLCQSFVWAQSFTSNVASTIPTNFTYLSNTINVTGVGNLDGSSIGVVSVEFSLTAGTVANGNTVYNEVEIYLESPDGHAVYIMDNDLSITNKTFVFSNDPGAAFFKYVQFNATTPINNPYSPAVNFNALNQGQSANGTWRLYAKKSVAQAPATINSWKLTFGTTHLAMGAPNQTCRTALPLPNTTLTGNSVSGTNMLNGIVVSDSRGSEVGSSGLTETSIWYSFSPICKNDTIQITGRDGYIQSGILGGTCGARSTIRSYKDLFNMTYNYLITNYTQGNTYFLAMDGSQADGFSYQVKWLKGSVGCPPSTLTTSNPANSVYCAGDSLYVPFTFTGTFNANNRFTAELSDANGSFSSPLTIGFLNGASGTFVRSRLPDNVTKGQGYRVRIVSSDPVVTGTVSPKAFEVKTIPSTPTVLDGRTSICSTEVDLPYSVGPITDDTHYRWTVASAVQLTSSVPDSASITVSSWPISNTISVRAVNVCGSSAALQKNISIVCTTLTTSNVANSIYCAGDSLYVPFTFTGTFNANNRFTAQLSDANGSFVSPLVIGFLDGASGTLVKSRLPANLIKGTGYKLRIVSSDPALTGTTSPTTFEVKTIPSPPTVLSGKTSVCPNETQLVYSISPLPDTRYRWTFTSPVQVSSSALDSASITVSSWPMANTISVRAVNVCGTSTVLQKNITHSNSQAPTLSITSSQNNVCEGDSVAFSSQISNAGNNPLYQWKVNGQNQGSNSPFFVSTFLKDKDTVSLTVKSEGTCLLVDSAQSNKWVMVVKEAIYPDVTVNGNTSFCSGREVTFFASTLNKGTKPLLKWYVNSVLIDTRTDSLFVSSLLKDKDTLWVTLESNALCARPPLVVSPKMILQVKPSVTASLVLTGATTSCKGEDMGFIATPQGGDRSPFYTWYLNEEAKQETSSNFSSRFLNTGDKIRVTMNNGEECASPPLIQSNTLLITVLDTVTPTLSIHGDTLSCKGQTLSFSTSSTYGGTKPQFSWALDGNALPDTGSALSLKNMASGKHTLTAYLTSSEKCPRPRRITQDITFTVKDSLFMEAQIEGDTVVCKGSMATFSLKTPLSLPDLRYEWKVNKVLFSDKAIFASSSLAQDDAVSLTLNTSTQCANSTSITSNVLSVEIKDIQPPSIGYGPLKSASCPGEEVIYTVRPQFTGSNPRYTWYHNNVELPFKSDTIRITPSSTSVLEVVYQDVFACGAYTTPRLKLIIEFLESPLLQILSGPSEYCAQDSTLLFTTDLLSNATYIWLYPSYASARPIGNKIYLDLKGTTQTDSLKVTVANACGVGNTLSLLLSPKNCSTLFIPNTILASSNNGNELWQIRGLETNEEVKVMVFNRWGNKVYQSNRYSTPWDGTYGGKLLPTGTYYYLIERGKDTPIVGTLTIVH